MLPDVALLPVTKGETTSGTKVQKVKTRGKREGTRENERRPEVSSKREAWQDADETDAQGPGRELVQMAPNKGPVAHTPGHIGPEVGPSAVRDPSSGQVPGCTEKRSST